MNKRVVIIDGDFLLYYATYPNKVNVDISNTDGDTYVEEQKIPKSLDEVYVDVNKRLKEIFQNTNATHYIGYLSMPSFRKVVNPEYKANRKDFIKPQWFDECKQYLLDKWKFVWKADLEADDCVNITENILFDRKTITLEDLSYIRVSNDKDVIKLFGECYNPIKKEFIYTDHIDALSYFWKSMIIGDSADGIKGLPGKGKVFADNLFVDNENLENEVPLSSLCFQAYLQHFGEYKGIEQFYKNYKSLKILNEYPGFVLPEIQKIERD
jgi:hypothetical protein